MKKIYILFFALLCLTTGYTQTALNVFDKTGQGYTTTAASDYECLGINPANLGWSWDNHMVNLGFLETGISIYTNALTKNQVTRDLFNNSIKLDSLGKANAASNFSNTRLWGQGGVTWLGLSVNIPKIGGFAISIRDRLWNTVLNHAAAQFLFLGYNDKAYFDSTVIKNGDTTGFASYLRRQKASSCLCRNKTSFPLVQGV